MNIYITRHSKTIWNEERRLQGQKDSALTQEGIANAIALKNHIHDMKFDLIYSSPIQRAFQTATLLFDQENIIKDKRLGEMNFGIFEGRKIKDILDENAELYDCLWNHPERFDRIPNGESYDEVIRRARLFLYDLEHKNVENVFIVTHGMFFVVLLSTMLEMNKEDFIHFNQQIVEGCSLTHVHYDGCKYKLVDYNLHDYLPYSSHTLFSKA